MSVLVVLASKLLPTTRKWANEWLQSVLHCFVCVEVHALIIRPLKHLVADWALV